MKSSKITGMRSLQKRKQALSLELRQQEAEMTQEVESIIWPFHVFRKYKHTAESIADNKLFVVGVEFAKSIISAAWKRKKEKAEQENHGVTDFLKEVANEFLSNYGKKEKTEEQE